MPDDLAKLLQEKGLGLTSKVAQALTTEADIAACLPLRTSDSATPWRVPRVRWSQDAPEAEETVVVRRAVVAPQEACEVIAALDHSLDDSWTNCEGRLVALAAPVGTEYRRIALTLALQGIATTPYTPHAVLEYVRTPGSWHVYGPSVALAEVEKGGLGRLTDAKDRLKVAGLAALVVSADHGPLVTQLDVPPLTWEPPGRRTVRFWVTRRFFVDGGQGTHAFAIR